MNKLMSVAIGLLGCLMLAAPGQAGKFNSVRNIVTSPRLGSISRGRMANCIRSKISRSFDVVVVVFTCNSCPYAVDYEERINALAAKYKSDSSRATVVAINVNKIEADQLPAMKQRVADRKLIYPYLYDESQSIAKAYGAVRTPEFFVLNKERRIVYMVRWMTTPRPIRLRPGTSRMRLGDARR